MGPDQCISSRNLPQLNTVQVLIWRRDPTKNSFMPKHIPGTHGEITSYKYP